MGAAEYEWGVYSNCLDKLKQYGTKLYTIRLYPDNIRNSSLPIYVVSSKGCEDSEVEEQIRYLYFTPSLALHETGSLPEEISKADCCSFYKTCRKVANCNFKDIRTHGWLNVKGFYAFFIDRELAESFNQYFNNVLTETV